MRWAEVYAYIMSVAPDLAVEMVGVPEEHIVACETNWGMVFPPAYREFLLTLGVAAGRFRPLGGYAVWDFYEILRDPPDEYEPRELLRISTETDDSLVTHNDYYLDMRTLTPDGDCELLRIEWAMPPHRADAIVAHRTLLERVVETARIQLDAKRFRFSRTLTGVSKEVDIPQLYANAIELLRRQGFVPSSPSSSRIACWVRNTPEMVSASIYNRERLVGLSLASDSEQAVGRLVHLVIDNLPPMKLPHAQFQRSP